MEESRAPKRRRNTKWAAAPGQPKPSTFTRALRPGQRPPKAPLGIQSPLPPTGGPQSAPRADHDGPSDHQKEMKRKQEACDKARPQNIEYYCEYARKLMALRVEQATAAAAITQQAVEVEGEALLEEPCRCCGGKVALVKLRDVEVIDFGHRYLVQVPEFVCDGAACTRPSFSVEPIVAGCAPTAPTIDCSKWISVAVVTLFSDLQLCNGLAGAGGFLSSSSILQLSHPSFLILCAAFGHALDNLDREMRPRGSVLVPADPAAGRPMPTYSAPVTSQQLTTTAIEYRKVVSKASRVCVVDSDPLGECFVCALATKTELSNGKNMAQILRQALPPALNLRFYPLIRREAFRGGCVPCGSEHRRHEQRQPLLDGGQGPDGHQA